MSERELVYVMCVRNPANLKNHEKWRCVVDKASGTDETARGRAADVLAHYIGFIVRADCLLVRLEDVTKDRVVISYDNARDSFPLGSYFSLHVPQ